MTTASPYQLPKPDLSWDQQGAPHSNAFDDIYFSREHGLEETQYVFLQHNQLAERWQQLDQPLFTIAETGFGTGLNFLAAAQLWLEAAPETARLLFVTVEKFPLSRQQLQQALAVWPEFGALSEELIEHYPVQTPGFHRLALANGRITLQLMFGEASEQFRELLDCDHPELAQQYGGKVDAWFLDGFAPAKNPQMWSDELFRAVGELSRPGTTFATFTAAGIVKRGLKAQGFALKKVPGYGRKREMLTGLFEAHQPAEVKRGFGATWSLNQPPTTQQVAVLGAGIAGATTARALAERGYRVTVIERHAQAGEEASGNPQGVLYTKLSHQAGVLNQFTLTSYLFAQRYYRQLWEQGVIDSSCGDFTGVLQLAISEREQQAMEKILDAFAGHEELIQGLTAEQASEIASIPLTNPALWFPLGGWLVPPTVCARLLDHPLIECRFNTEVEQLHHSDQGWQLVDSVNNPITSADSVVIATANHAVNLDQSGWLPLKPIRGQVTTAPASEISAPLRTVICHEGYISPALKQRHCFGATFDHSDNDPSVRISDHHRNLQTLDEMLPGLLPDTPKDEELTGRTGYRCTTPDYAPLTGPAPQLEEQLERFTQLRRNARSDIPEPGCYYPGLYLNVGHGSRGLTSAPLCAELIAAQIGQELPPLPRTLRDALAPSRFLIRDLIRNRR